MKKGFTLIELLVYISLAAIILNVGIYFIWQMIDSKVKVTAKHEVQRNIIFVLEKISHEARLAKLIETPQSQGEESPELVLLMSDNTKRRFFVDQGQLFLTRDAGGNVVPIALTSPKVKVDNLIFKNLSGGGGQGTFQINIKIKYYNPVGRQEYQADLSTQKTINLRDNLGEI